MTKKEDEGILPVRRVRSKISAEFDNDPIKLVEHYRKEQERYADRLLRSTPPRPRPAAERPSAGL